MYTVYDGCWVGNTNSGVEDDQVRSPPRSARGIAKYLGPSFAIVAVTIGSGELIATTLTGAEAGIVVLWFLVLSLIVKVGIQYQFSKYGLIEGKTPHEVFDEVPGQIFGHSWAWWWMVFFWLVVNNIQYMGVFFGAGVLLHYLTAQTIPIALALPITLVLAVYPSLKGYDFVEDFATVIVLGLTVITVAAAVLSFNTPYALTTEEMINGLSFNLPTGGATALFAAVGITGIAANELVGYATYVQETGYGLLAGSRTSEGWKSRMEGWLRVMKVDVIVSVILVVIITVAFLIVGASVIAGLGEYPSGPELGVFLANAYGELFGPIGYWILLVGGFFALYSTVFGQTQVVAVVWPDWLLDTQVGEKLEERIGEDGISTVVTIALPIVWYLGGYIQGAITPLIVLGGILFTITYIPEIITAAWTLRNEQDQPRELQTTGLARIAVWASIIGSSLLVASIIAIQFI